MIKIAAAAFVFAIISHCSANERSHSYEDFKPSLVEGIEKIISQLTENEDHMKDDYEDDFGVGLDDVDNVFEKDKTHMTMQFFRMHDYNKDNFLDGNELLKSMTHEHGDHDNESAQFIQERIKSASEIVDAWLIKSDLDQDGMLSFAEYKYDPHH